jgi:PIN domain nuclease of toxin-antitoxin system
LSEAVVLDASALLAFIFGEPGDDKISALLAKAVISAVNLSEVAAKLSERGFERMAVKDLLLGLGLEISPFTSQEALEAGALRPVTRKSGLSFGDRACIALALQRGLPVATSDTAFQIANLPTRIVLVR